MSLRRLLALWTFLLVFVVPVVASAQALAIDGSVAGPADCPLGGTAVDALCEVSPTPAANRGCMYGGEVEFDSVELTNNAVLCVRPFDGVDRVNTGNLVLKSLSTIEIDESSKVSAKGAGYQGVLCDDGPGPTAASGGKGGCSVLDSGGGGAHFGQGGRGTKDCFLVGSATSCQFPDEFEEDCGSLVAGACVASPDPACYGGGADPDAGDGQPSVAGQAFRHNILDIEFGAAGGDKGCRDGFDGAPRAGDGGGRVVLFAANDAGTGAIDIRGSIIANGARGCSSGNDSAGGGAGGTILVVGDFVSVGETAVVAAHGGRGGDSQMKCLPCTTAADCGTTGQACTDGMCAPCNCTPCSSNAQCATELGQTCRDIDGGGAMPSICVNADDECTPFDPGENERECAGTQVTGTCDDCGGAGGGGILNIQSRLADIHPHAVFNVRGGKGGICPICSGEAGGGAGELQIDSAYVGEICDGYDNDFDGEVDEIEDLGMITCPNGDMIDACVGGLPQTCDYEDEENVEECLVAAADARPRFSLIVDTSGSMLNDLEGVPTFGDGSVEFPGVDTDSDGDAIDGNNARLFIAKDALRQVLSSFPESDYALARYYQDVGLNRSCQTASNFECAASCCSYDDPRDNILPIYPDTHPDNFCVLNQLYPSAGYPADPAFNANMEIGWDPIAGESPATTECINYAGSCGPPRRGAQYLVGFNQPITRYLSWLDGVESDFDDGIVEGNHCAGGDCELRGTGPTPLGNALEATYDFLTPTIACDEAKECRSYTTILLTDGAESCEGDPAGAAAQLLTGVSGKIVRTYVIGFSVDDDEEDSLNQIAIQGGTSAAIFVDDKEELADALAQIIGQDQRFELCNGDDDDCDGDIDEDFPELGDACSDGLLGVCAGTGTIVCSDDFLGTVCDITDPGIAPSDEICNGLDDDCDGLIDEDENNLPLDCSTCVVMDEICDGIDNDCDLAIDEEADVFENQPDDYGIPCGELEAPNDQAPCKLGVVRCINGGPLCLGFVGPGVEICNGQDDDCDGIGDNDATCPGETQCVEGQCVFECDSGEFPCPGGYECRDGFCFQRDCDDVNCPDGQTCVAGLCVDEEPSGSGGGSGQGGGAGQGGSGQQATGVGGAAQTGVGPSGPASSTGDQGAGGGDGDNYGLVTGGGGLKCSTSTAGASDPARGAAALLVALGAVLATRRARRGGDR